MHKILAFFNGILDFCMMVVNRICDGKDAETRPGVIPAFFVGQRGLPAATLNLSTRIFHAWHLEKCRWAAYVAFCDYIKRGNNMSPRIILASVLGISVLCSNAAFAQTNSGPGGSTSGTTGGSMGSGTSGGSMGSGSLGGTQGTSGTTSGTINSQLNNSSTTPSPYMGAGKGSVQTAPNSSGQGSGSSGGYSK
jgi:hypothetical protein